MPIYEYSCNACGKKFEALLQKDEKAACESCGSGNLKKLFSSFAVHAGTAPQVPDCSSGCEGGFNQGTCGSGMCGGH